MGLGHMSWCKHGRARRCSCLVYQHSKHAVWCSCWHATKPDAWFCCLVAHWLNVHVGTSRATDCLDYSANTWEELLPLSHLSAAAAVSEQGLDFIAP